MTFPTYDYENDIEFQFPSNGKAYPKEFIQLRKEPIESPKFQFPSNGKAYPKRRTHQQ